MVHAELRSSSGKKSRDFVFSVLCGGFLTLILIGFLTFFLSRPTCPHPGRLSPAASAPASSSPAAPLPTRPLSARRWRFTVCWWWISTPSKVRLPRAGPFLFDLAVTLHCTALQKKISHRVYCDQNDHNYRSIVEMCSKCKKNKQKKVLIPTLKSFNQILFLKTNKRTSNSMNKFGCRLR